MEGLIVLIKDNRLTGGNETSKNEERKERMRTKRKHFLKGTRTEK